MKKYDPLFLFILICIILPFSAILIRILIGDTVQIGGSADLLNIAIRRSVLESIVVLWASILFWFIVWIVFLKKLGFYQWLQAQKRITRIIGLVFAIVAWLLSASILPYAYEQRTYESIMIDANGLARIQNGRIFYNFALNDLKDWSFNFRGQGKYLKLILRFDFNRPITPLDSITGVPVNEIEINMPPRLLSSLKALATELEPRLAQQLSKVPRIVTKE